MKIIGRCKTIPPHKLNSAKTEFSTAIHKLVYFARQKIRHKPFRCAHCSFVRNNPEVNTEIRKSMVDNTRSSNIKTQI